MNRIKVRLDPDRWVVLLLIAVTVLLDSTTSSSHVHLRPFSLIFPLVALAAVIYGLLRKRRHGWELALYLLLPALGAASYIFSGHASLLLLLTAAILLEGDRQELYLKTVFVVRGAVALAVVLYALVFLGGGEVVAVMKSGHYTFNGITLGFTHPNQLALTVSALLILFLCIRKDPMSPRVFLTTLAIALLVFLCTGSRSMLFCTGFFFLGVFLFRKRRLPTWLCIGLFLLIALLGIGLPAAFPYLPQPIRWLDKLCSNRSNFASGVFRAYSQTLFGLNLQAPLRIEGLVVDNGYVQLLFRYGIVGFCIWFIMNILLMYRLLKAGKQLPALALLTFAAWGMMEDILICSCINFPLVLWCLCLTPAKERVRK